MPRPDPEDQARIEGFEDGLKAYILNNQVRKDRVDRAETIGRLWFQVLAGWVGAIAAGIVAPTGKTNAELFKTPENPQIIT